jgi:hypothetical protein
MDINAENLRELIVNKFKQLFILIVLSTESEPILAIKKYMVSENLKNNSMKVQKNNYLDLFAPDLRHTSYRDLHGKPLQLPKNKAYFPKKEALKWRCYHCGWYR